MTLYQTIWCVLYILFIPAMVSNVVYLLVKPARKEINTMIIRHSTTPDLAESCLILSTIPAILFWFICKKLLQKIKSCVIMMYNYFKGRLQYVPKHRRKSQRQ